METLAWLCVVVAAGAAGFVVGAMWASIARTGNNWTEDGP